MGPLPDWIKQEGIVGEILTKCALTRLRSAMLRAVAARPAPSSCLPSQSALSASQHMDNVLGLQGMAMFSAVTLSRASQCPHRRLCRHSCQARG